MKKIIIQILLLLPSMLPAIPLPLAIPTNSNDHYWSADANKANSITNHFVEPDDSINYTNYRYVGAHNAYSYTPHFFLIAYQQDQTILSQLSYGVRGLMLDTYPWTLTAPNTLVGPTSSTIALSHDTPGSALAAIQKGTTIYQSLQFELRRVVEFLKANPKAVITIILEDYADWLQTAVEIKDVMIEAQYNPLFTFADLVNNQWPTLGWMRQHNKRLVIFTQRAPHTDVTFSEFLYTAENQYDTVNATALCQPRAESHVNGPLVVFNSFEGTGITPPLVLTSYQASYNTAKSLTTNCQTQHFAGGRTFNGYWIDRVIDSCDLLYGLNQKTIFEYVNQLNA
ncbi:MAG TPA: hypothetical protein VKU36_02605 [Candidatus Babeliales bacterium]|nr:hypothetical protein [Candidatus Babeliales bacterium]